VRIISKEKDYYDSVQRYGQNQELIYIRQKKEFDVKIDFPFPKYNYLYSPKNIYCIYNVIGFCGQVYLLVEIHNFQDKGGLVYTAEETIDFMKGQKSFKETDIKWANELFTEFDKQRTKYRWIFEKYNCPIFLYCKERSELKYKLITNPLLRPYEFYRVKDVVTTFQELQMYLDNLAKPEKVIPVMPDKVKIGNRGFDKFSFRKSKSD